MPENIENFSKKKLGGSGFTFPSVEEIIKNYFNLGNLASITKNIFPELTNDIFYNLYYRIQSEFLHGKIYLLMKNVDKPQNEKFWLISHCEIISFLFIELVDKNILDKNMDKDIKKLFEKFKRNSSSFKNLWLTKRNLCRT